MLHRLTILAFLAALLLATGCGSTKQHTVTEQLLSSDAVDRAVSQIDFRVLSGKKVYIDTSYIQPAKNVGFVNDRYIVSSLRQQMAAVGCLLQDSAKEADVVVEPRVGALGTDMHEVVYGIPANNLLSNVASLAPGAPQLPAIPEISVAKKNQHLGAAKISVFAYESESRDPLWQSGIAQAESRARDTWVLGAGPFQSGTIYNRTQFAGSEINVPLVYGNSDQPTETELTFEQAHVFHEEPEPAQLPEPVRLAKGSDNTTSEIRPLNHEEPVAREEAEKQPPKEKPPAESQAAQTKGEKKEKAETEPASKQASAPENSNKAASLPADLRQHLEQFSQPMQESTNPWYHPSPQVSVVD